MSESSQMSVTIPNTAHRPFAKPPQVHTIAEQQQQKHVEKV